MLLKLNFKLNARGQEKMPLGYGAKHSQSAYKIQCIVYKGIHFQGKTNHKETY